MAKPEYQGVLLDLSGVLYVGSKPLPGAQAALDRLRQAGLPIRFVTNTSRTPRRRILEQLAGMGFELAEDELITAPQAARAYLERHGLTPYLLIHPDLRCEFEDYAGAGEPDAVLLGDAGHDFRYETLNQAFRVLMRGGPLVATGDNRYFREADGLSLDAGPFVRALEYAAGIEAVITGKPAAAFYQAAVESLGCQPGKAVMVGDDVAADVLGARAAGLHALLVRTGKYQPGDEAQLADSGALCVADIGEAVAHILGEV